MKRLGNSALFLDHFLKVIAYFPKISVLYGYEYHGIKKMGLFGIAFSGKHVQAEFEQYQVR